MARQRGVSATGVIGLYVLYNFTYVLSAWPLGHLADRLGPRRLLVGGLLIFAVVYGGVALAQGPWVFAGFFALYGLYAAATEGVSKAWVSTLCAPADTGAALDPDLDLDLDLGRRQGQHWPKAPAGHC